MKISKKQYKKIVAKLWICEYNEKENEEIKFRKKARHFLIRNREAFYKIEENLQYYEDIFYLMYMLLKKDCYLKRTDLEREYELLYAPLNVHYDMKNMVMKRNLKIILFLKKY